MNFTQFQTYCEQHSSDAAKLANDKFARASDMEYFVNPQNGYCSTFVGSSSILWYGFEPTNRSHWHDTHIMQGENWIYNSIKNSSILSIETLA